MIFRGIIFKFRRQSEDEAGNAGEQPVSNKIDAYTVVRKQSLQAAFFIDLTTSKLYGSETSKA